jgi:glycerophosphoryl diester phosphodiesterase
MILPIQVSKSFRIIAHRGASAYAPENTRAAFDLALKMGVYEVELDTQMTVDGQIVLCHDRMLERYGHGPAVIEELRWAELRDLDMGSWFSPFLYRGEQMLSLDALFETYGPSLMYHVELKGQADKLPEAVSRAIDEHGLRAHCIVTSFSFDALAAMKQIQPALRLGWLVQQIDAQALDKAQQLGLFQLCPRADQVSRASVAQAAGAVSEVRAWGVNGTSAEVLRLILNVLDAGCHGMTINWPDWVCHEKDGIEG